MQKRLNIKEKDEVVKQYQDGDSAVVIQERWGVGSTTVYRLLDSRGIERRTLLEAAKTNRRLEGQEQIVVQEYIEGRSMESIGNKFGVCADVITRILSKHNIEARPSAIILLQGQETEVIRCYKEGMTTAEIGERFSVCVNVVHRILKDRDIPLRDKRIKRSIDSSFFETINSEAKAYFLGLMYADGYNGEAPKYGVSLHLQSRDIDILHKFQECMQSTHPLQTRTVKAKDYLIFSVSNKSLSEGLSRWGCYRAKSLTLVFPEWLPDDLLPHFIRGYIDGDGNICVKGKHVYVKAIGSAAFIERLMAIIREKCAVKSVLFKGGENPKVIQGGVFGRTQTVTVLAWLYKDATVWLDRKKRQAEQVLVPVYRKTRGK